MAVATRPPTGAAAPIAGIIWGLALAGCNAIFGLDPVRTLAETAPDASVGGAGGAGMDGAGGGVGRGVGSCGPNLLRNGAFDEGTTGWTTVPSTEIDIRSDDDAEVSTQLVTPHSPRYLARLGGPRTYLVTWLEQNLVIPLDARELTVSGSILIKTDEDPDMVYDVARLELVVNAMSSRRMIAWSNLSAASGWTPFTGSVNVADLAGLRVAFRIYAELDANTASYFFFDTVALSVTGCEP